MPHLVSVIIPSFNPGPMLRPALRSVLRQSHPDIEVIFVDNNATDGSTEEARAILTEAGRPFTLIQCPEQGVNHARNLGYTKARGDFIQWMDADDQLNPDKIALQAAALHEHPRDDIAYGDWSSYRAVPGKPDIVDHFSLRQEDDQRLRTLSGVWYPPHLYLLRRAAADRLQANQAWWPSRPVGTDIEYSALAALLGVRFRHVPGARVRYNIWSDSQISGGTPYHRRVVALRAIFARLRDFAGTTLPARHRFLLEQNWDVWRMPPNFVAVTKLSERRFIARRLTDGHQIELRPREAAVARLMARGSPALAMLHHALAMVGRLPELAGDHVPIIRTIDMFRREGMPERVAQPEDD